MPTSTSGGFRLEEIQERHAALIDAFNDRMKRGGSDQRLSVAPSFSRIDRSQDSPIAITSYVAMVAGAVRGGVNIKVMPFKVDGAEHRVAFYNRPLSEGIVDPQWSMVGTMIQKTVAKQFPLVYGLGVGSREEPVARLMVATGWSCEEVPFLFKVLKARAFLANTVALRRTKARAFVATVLRNSGLGSLALVKWRLFLWLVGRSAQARARGLEIEAVDRWDDWADVLWTEESTYRLVGDRSAAALNALYPETESLYRRLRVSRDGRTLGWAVVIVAQLRGHNHFGDLKLGSLVDAFGAERNADAICAAAVAHIEDKDCDLIVANLSHAAWVKAAQRSGLWRGPSNFLMFLSKKLQALLAGSAGGPASVQQTFFTRGDGDGPANLY